MCLFYAVLVRCMYVRHPFCPVRVRFLYVTYPVCVRYASVTRPFYSVSTSTDSQRITILSTDNFYFHPLGVRSCYPVRCDQGLFVNDYKDLQTNVIHQNPWGTKISRLISNDRVFSSTVTRFIYFYCKNLVLYIVLFILAHTLWISFCILFFVGFDTEYILPMVMIT